MSESHEEELAELTAYLPMLRRLASYESWGEASIPDELTQVSNLLSTIGGKIESYLGRAGTDESSAPVGLRRPAGEDLPPKARRVWRQDPEVLAALEAAASVGDDQTFRKVWESAQAWTPPS